MMEKVLPDLTGRLNDLESYAEDGVIRLGLLGGTFDPIHLGHLRIAEEVREYLDLAGVLFIPAGRPVFKKDENVTDARIRLNQVIRAISDNPHFGVSDLEIERSGDTFTIDTLRMLRDLYPSNVSFYFIVGSDAAASLPLWRESSELSKLATFVVAGKRPHAELQQPEGIQVVADNGFALIHAPVRALDISSREIRMLVQAGRSIRYLVPEGIRKEVQARYASGGDTMPQVIEAARLETDPMSDAFYEACRKRLQARVSKKRYEHSMGVAQTAQELARVYDVDQGKARLAGILHDWDKAYNDEEIRDRVYELNMQDELDPNVVESMPAVLHGMTAARALAFEFPQIPADIIQAIARHTIADENMEPLDMVVYIADALEPGRQYPEIDELRALVGMVELEELFFRVFQYWVDALLTRQRTIYPDTIRIWNTYVNKLYPREGFVGHDRKN